jgi:hypothetical protein
VLTQSDLLRTEWAERELRRQIDCSVSRALVDHEYARDLLANPTLLLEGRGCPPQHLLRLRNIKAESLTEFARQAEALFWLDRQPRFQDDERPVVAAAAM